MTDPGFSGILRLTDLNDFIGPSQECIKPVLIDKSPSQSGSVKISYDGGGDYSEVNSRGVKTVLKPAQITLNDCLACSGCVTSAETVLIQQQSAQQLLDVLEKKRLAQAPSDSKVPLVVVSLSPQSLASLAAKYRLTSLESYQKASGFLKQLGVDYVFDTVFARHLTLLAEQEEFVERLRRRESSEDAKLPMLASSCPGWICYAEKSHGEWILPRISTVRSPQAIMGVLVKDYLGRKLGRTPEEVFHVTVMPCFDKKLEASRKDFVFPATEVREVDSVISTAELDELVIAKCGSLTAAPASPLDTCLFPADGRHLPVHSGGGSGGYAENVFRFASLSLFGVESTQLRHVVTKNKDMHESMLTKDDQVVLRVAICYGFRNIQNLVQKLRRGRCNYDYVEVMACPSGCLNGGGQIRSENAEERRALFDRVTSAYEESGARIHVRPDDDTQQFLRDWLGEEGLSSERARRLLHTQYHPIEKANLSLGIKW